MQEVATLEQELEAAKQRVSELEDLRSARVKDAAETNAAIEAAASKLSQLVEEMRKHRNNVAVSAGTRKPDRVPVACLPFAQACQLLYSVVLPSHPA